MRAAFIEVEGVSVRYGGTPAVREVSLGLAQGQVGVLVGPSGCGKTSLLRAIAGLETIAEGRVRIAGGTLSDAADSLRVPAEHRHIGMVFQDYALFPHLSVAENIAYGLHALPRGERPARVAAMLALVGLPEAGARLPHELSGGQQQRIALARALAPAPRLLLLDEPFSSLDVELRERLAQEVRQILHDSGTTALIVTHDQNEAFALGDVVGVMNAGRLEQWAEPYTLYHRPATRFVADFIGQGVFTPARLATAEDGRRLLHTPLGLLEHPAAAGPDGPCDLLLRADDVIHDDASPLQARVERKAFRGAEFLYALRLATGESLLALVPSHHDHAIGEWIGIRPALDHIVSFAPADRA